MTIKVFTDGASKGNPGKSGIGILITNDTDEELLTHSEYIGETTNNVAEYSAFIKSLELIKSLNQADRIKKIEFFADSELLVKQINGQYKVRDSKLNLLHTETKSILSGLNIIYTINYIPRTENKIADKLANEAIKNFNTVL
ncbi:MAG TPA: ribonuclease HI family protein [Ignavibacteria bacterium]|nr:ribonuclease HI family protein [Ignavibacteria bacterium]